MKKKKTEKPIETPIEKPEEEIEDDRSRHALYAGTTAPGKSDYLKVMQKKSKKKAPPKS